MASAQTPSIANRYPVPELKNLPEDLRIKILEVQAEPPDS